MEDFDEADYDKFMQRMYGEDYYEVRSPRPAALCVPFRPSGAGFEERKKLYFVSPPPSRVPSGTRMSSTLTLGGDPCSS